MLGADEISSDGKNWIMVDRHYQLRKFFSNKDSQKNVLEATNSLRREVEISESLPDLENELQEVANLLRDINK